MGRLRARDEVEAAAAHEREALVSRIEELEATDKRGQQEKRELLDRVQVCMCVCV
jgi:hypothetical protein